MIFSSLEFVCVFFPVIFLLHCLPGMGLKNGILIAASLLFYAFGEPKFVLLMIFSAGVNYIFARLAAGNRYRKGFLYAAAAANIGLLIYFKYIGFILETWNQVSGMHLTVQHPELPAGISFFTFQALSYVIDVYYGRVKVQKSFWKVLLYISFFPQLIAGPIVKYRDIEDALTERKMDFGQAADGMRRFICGLGKKVLIADTVGQAADAVFGAGCAEINMFGAWIGAAAFMLQIYYDFSGYSDMAIGLGRMFGFQFQENFRYPYGAAGIREFWRRWHISLSAWFREYLYIPLGGNRKGKLRTGIHKFIVFFCTGLWHGADWTFVIWGFYHGMLSVIEDAVPFLTKIPRPVRQLFTLLAVCIGFVIFRADSITQAWFMIHQMFAGSVSDRAGISFAASRLTPWFLAASAAGLAGMAPVKPVTAWIQEKVYGAGGQHGIMRVFLNVASILLLAWCIVRMSGSTYHPFIYFRF